MGDPIEVEAVSRVFQRKLAGNPLLIGSVKTNLGHSEAASGFSSIFKVALALEKGIIPPTIGVTKVNPKIKTREWGVEIVTEQIEWPRGNPDFVSGQVKRRAGINSFGYGGANSHVILEAAEDFIPPNESISSSTLAQLRPRFILPVSANSSVSLKKQINQISSTDLTGFNVVDLAYTLGCRRSNLATRAFTLAGNQTLQMDLDPHNFISMDENQSYPKLPIAFVFTGQGAQWAQMAKELIEEFPSFRRSLVELDNAIQKLPEAPQWTIRQAILEEQDVSQINHVTRSQPICTAIQIAYVQLLAKWGIRPETVIGHSSGEIAAAFASGFLTAEEAIVTAYYRGHVVGKSDSPVQGAMMATGLGQEQAQSQIDSLNLTKKIKVACINSSDNVTISGDADAIETLMLKLQEAGVFARKLNTNGRAYHSHHMSLYGPEYEALLEKNMPSISQWKKQKTAHWVSSVSGEEVSDRIGSSYWRANLESPVRFSEAVETLLKSSKYHIIEIGPHSALELPIKQTRSNLNIKEDNFRYSSALNRGKNAVKCVLNMVGNLFLHGHKLDFAQINYVEPSTTVLASHIAPYPRHRQGKVLPILPPYPWSYDTILWDESRASAEYRFRKYPHHDLLGSRIPGGDQLHISWRNMLKTNDVPWLKDHKLEETVVFPGAGFLAMAMEGVWQAVGKNGSDSPSFSLRHVQILKALVLPTEKTEAATEIFTYLRPTALSGTTNSIIWWDFEITSVQRGLPTIHAVGMISCDGIKSIQPKILPSSLDLESLAIRNWYGQFNKVGLNFGPAFTSIMEIQTPRSKTGMHAIAKTRLLQGGGDGIAAQSAYVIHPITIDTMLQSGIIASTSGVIKELGPSIPVSIEEAYFRTPNISSQETWFIDAAAEKVGFGTSLISAALHDGQGQICAHLKGVHATGYQGTAQVQEEENREPILRLLWKPDVSTLSSQGFGDYLQSCGVSRRSICRIDLS